VSVAKAKVGLAEVYQLYVTEEEGATTKTVTASPNCALIELTLVTGAAKAGSENVIFPELVALPYAFVTTTAPGAVNTA
jgi:hypothetical protein